MENYNFNQMGFYKPYQDTTGKVDLMRYLNNGYSYGYNEKENLFYLCSSPILEASIIEILSSHENFEEVKKAFYTEKSNLN